MKKYDHLMQNIRFREDICEEILRNAQNQQKNVLPRSVAIAACLCLCTVTLLSTVLAVPQLRALIFSSVADSHEVVRLPEESAMVENKMEVVTARYYKLDGELNAHEGFGSMIPVKKEGKTTFYCITENGKMEVAGAPRTIQKELSYEGKNYYLDMQIYEGDVPTIVKSERIFPMTSNNTYVLTKENNGVSSPLFVDLDTWQIEDPMRNIDFTPPEGAKVTRVSATQGGSIVLINAEMQDESRNIYCADCDTGKVLFMENATIGEWFLSGERVYRYRNGLLSTLDENGEMLTLFGGAQCAYTMGSQFASIIEGHDIRLVLLPTGEEIVLKNGVALFDSDPTAIPNHAQTKFCVTAPVASDSFNSRILAIADIQTGEMVALERTPGMKEEMMGWFDNETFLIAGTVGEQWYVCLYHICK